MKKQDSLTMVSVRLSVEMKEKLCVLCKQDNHTYQSLLLELIEKYLEESRPSS